MTATTIFDLYRGRLNVWVEDDLTRVILTDLWQDRQIHVINAGGSGQAAERPPTSRQAPCGWASDARRYGAYLFTSPVSTA